MAGFNLDILDLSDPLKVKSVGRYITGHRSSGVKVSGHLVFITSEHVGLQIIGAIRCNLGQESHNFAKSLGA